MKILAVDQSYTSSGIVILEDGQMTHFEIFSTDPSKDIFSRAWDASCHIKLMAERHNPDHVCMEGLAFSKFGNATRDLAGLQFVIVTVMRFLEKYSVIVIPPNTVKKVATGSGKAKKEQLLESLPSTVREQFIAAGAKKTKGLYDLSDAYWIGKAGLVEIEKYAT